MIWTTSLTALSPAMGNQSGSLDTAALPFNNGQWHLVTLVNYNDNGTWRSRLYYNGGTQYIQFNTGNGGTIAELLKIGAMSSGYHTWHGQLDDFRIYKRALTQTEVATLYSPPSLSPYESWMNGLTNPPPAHLHSMSADPDGDGHNNLLEYALGSHPNNPADIAKPVFDTVGDTISLTYSRMRSDLTYTVQHSTDLIEWFTSGIDQSHSTPLGQPATAIYAPPADTDKVFLRLRVSSP